MKIWTIIHRCESQQRLGRALMWSKLKKARYSFIHDIKNSCSTIKYFEKHLQLYFSRSIAFSYRHCRHRLRKRKQKQLKTQRKTQNQLKHQSKSLITGFWCAFYLFFVYCFQLIHIMLCLFSLLYISNGFLFFKIFFIRYLYSGGKIYFSECSLYSNLGGRQA